LYGLICDKSLFFLANLHNLFQLLNFNQSQKNNFQVLKVP
jgi:hypothetical protein